MTLVLIALAVSMDAAAVAGGMAIRGLHVRDIVKLAVTFGAFQFLMAMLGAVGGKAIERHLSAFDHWIAFALLGFVGGKMIWEALARGEDEEAPLQVLPLHTVLALGVATSIDAFAVGVTLPTLELGALRASVIIGAVTFGLSLVGAWGGKRLGERFGKGVEILGGVVLLGIGAKALAEHLAS